LRLATYSPPLSFFRRRVVAARLVPAFARDLLPLACVEDSENVAAETRARGRLGFARPSSSAVVSTTVTLLTANVQKATQKLRLTVIKSNGWFVCDVQQV